jgi:hypothetical protein
MEAVVFAMNCPLEVTNPPILLCIHMFCIFFKLAFFHICQEITLSDFGFKSLCKSKKNSEAGQGESFKSKEHSTEALC